MLDCDKSSSRDLAKKDSDVDAPKSVGEQRDSEAQIVQARQAEQGDASSVSTGNAPISPQSCGDILPADGLWCKNQCLSIVDERGGATPTPQAQTLPALLDSRTEEEQPGTVAAQHIVESRSCQLAL